MKRVRDHSAPRIVLVGATGALGATVLELIGELGVRYRDIQLVASARSAGREAPVGGRSQTVVSLDDADFADADLVLFCTGEAVSARWAPAAAAAGALVVDSSGAFRTDPDTPLLVPPVNGHLMERYPGGIVAGAGGLTVPLVLLLHDIERRWGVRQVVLSSYQAASGRGHQGVEELLEGSELALRDPDAELPTDCFRPAQAFNVVPAVGSLLENGSSTEEQHLVQETRRILDLPHLNVAATCVRVPVVQGHSAAVYIEAGGPVVRRDLVELLASLPRVVVHDSEPPSGPPTPLTAGDPDLIHVGRIRVTPHNPRGFWLWLVFDNLRVAALNLLQIAQIAQTAQARPPRARTRLGESAHR
ncbi:aspartate-semialdehyde dehydrogenase [Streptomyces acidicola]|uniref:aspartate-semialdehyde dehydrogenase n=1 Tax=Streptomyces acidicola TaxID=2596892 RepID=UPI0037B5AD73